MNGYEEAVLSELAYLAERLAKDIYEQYAPPEVMYRGGAREIVRAIEEVLRNAD